MGAPYNPPTKNATFETYVSLRSFATPGSMQANPTLAAGDVKLYIDGVASTLGAGSSANLITLPTVVGTTVVVKVALGSTEMNGDNLTVVFIDQTSPKEWEDLVINIVPGMGGSGGGASAADIADAVWDEALSGHTTAGSAGKALGDIDTHTDTETGATAIRAAVGLASANLDTQLSGIQSDTDDIQTRIPAVLVSGRIDASVGAMASGVVTATAIATGAIDADAIATDGAQEIADALLDRTAGVETNRTVRQSLRLILAALTGKVSGAGSATVRFRDTNDSKDRITASVDADGNRTAVTLDHS